MPKPYNQNTLYYIDALLQYSNYSKASQSLYISQPYLTQVIKRIEDQLHCQIINRSQLPYRLTEQGKIYYEYLTSLENNYSKLLRDIDAVTDLKNKTIKIGVLPSLGSYLIPLFLPKFLETHPKCRVELFEDVPDINEKRLQNGDIDFWLGQNSRNISPNLHAISWGKHRYNAIIPKGSQLYRPGISILTEGQIPIHDLLNQKLVLTSKGSAIRKQIDQWLNIHKIESKIIIESSQINTVQKLAMANMGITFIPESLPIEECPEKYNIYPLPIDELNLDYFIAYVIPRKLSPLDKDLIDTFVLEPQDGGKENTPYQNEGAKEKEKDVDRTRDGKGERENDYNGI